MKSRIIFHNIAKVAAVLAANLFVSSAAHAARVYPKFTNVSPNPLLTNEIYVTATNMTVTNIGGTNVVVRVFIDDPPGGGGAPAGLPCPMLEVNVGTMIICHFRNNLTNDVEGASIHWHGIELNNDSDGTAITQDSILPGQTYLYKFIPPRAGLFWYHSHMIPGTSTFNGMYGPIIVTNSNEAALIASDILPTTNYTFPLLLSDISYTNGQPGKVVNGSFYYLNSLIQLCENNALGTNSADQPFCGPAGLPGNVVLVNGYPPSLAGSFGAPTTNSAPIYYVANNSRVRLQLFDASISRDFYLSLHYPSSDPTGNTNLYRIGGMGGFLDNAILEGGTQGGYNFLYNSGSIVIGTGMRADVMFYPSGANGTVIELVGNPLPSPPWNLSSATAPGPNVTNIPANYPIAFFIITNTGVTNGPLAAGSPIVAGTSYSNISLKLLPTNALISPPTLSEGITPLGTITSPQGTIIPAGSVLFENGLSANAATNNGYTPAGPNMNGYAAVALDGNTGDGSWLSVPHPPSALWARAGDVLQLAIINDVGGDNSMHPYHLHGFSMQPMYIYSANLKTNLYTFPYNEYLDELEVYPGTAIIFRIQLTDRPNFADSATGGPVTTGNDAPSGGNVGRWLMHCHIFLHGTIGMISELVVVSNTLNRLEGPGAGSDSAVLAGTPGVAWAATNNGVSWLHLSAANQSGTGSTNITFTYDANTGATRTGTLNIAGETVNVTQAGSTYIQAPGPVTQLVNTNNGISNPTQVAVDAAGNVYFCDSGNGAIKEWEVAHNGVATLITGLNDPQDMALDSQGNIYFTQYPGNTVTEWLASTHAQTTVPFTGLSQPEGVAVDGAGNVYVADPSQNAIKEWVAYENTTITVVSSNASTPLNAPYGVAVDVAGNVYIADTYDNAVKEYQPATGRFTTLVSSGYLDHPWNVAVDGAGNVYIADGYDNEIKEWIVATQTVSAQVGSLNDPTGVAVDAYQNLYIADYGDKAITEWPHAYVDENAIEVSGAAASYNLPAVLPTTADFINPFAPGSTQSWLTINGITNGVINYSVAANTGVFREADINVYGASVLIEQEGPAYYLGASSILVGPGAESNSVVLDVVPSTATWTASPLASWLHLSASNQSGTGSANVVFSFDANTGATRSGDINIGNLSTSVLLSVTQAGSNYVKAPGPLTPLVNSGLVDPVDVAVDNSGNVYLSDSGNNTIKKWTLATQNVTTLVNSSQISTPQGLAVDASGNVYFADFYNSEVDEWVAASNTIITLVSSPNLSTPEGVALDSSGNVYISDPTLEEVLEWKAANSNVVTLVSNGLSRPSGLRVDAAGNVYIADEDENVILKWTASSATVSTLISSGLSSPWSCAVDISGNVYIADGGSGSIIKWRAANGTLSTLVSGLSEPTDVAVDVAQNVYIANFGAAAVDEQPHAFVDPTAKTEGRNAGSDVLPVVEFPAENLLPPFFPTSDEPWLTINNATGDVVTFAFTANGTTANRTGHITLLGESIPVTQAGVVPQPTLIDAKLLSTNVFQFQFTNANQNATFTVLFTTNLQVPLVDWAAIGAATNLSPGVWQFTDTNASNAAGFFMVRSP